MMDDPIATADDIDNAIQLEPTLTWEHEALAQVKIKVIKAHSGAVNSCEYFDDDQKILTGSSDKTVKIFNIDDGKCEQTYTTDHSGIITEARGAPDRFKFFTSSHDKSVRMYDSETGKQLWSGLHEGMVMTCKFSSDGNLVASGSDLDNCLKIWDSKSGELVHSMPDCHESTVTCVLFAPDSDKIITTSMDKTTKFFDLRSMKTTIQLEGHINIVSSCDITRDERKFATGSWDKNLCIWDIATGSYRSKGPVKLCAGHEGSISCCKFSQDGELTMIVISVNPMLANRQRDIKHKVGNPWIQYTSDSSLMVVTGSFDQTVVVWDVENEVQKIKLQGHTDWVEDACFSQDQKWLMSCARDSTVRLWNIEDSDKIPIVLENKRAGGQKIIKCEKCGKPFSMAQLEDYRDLTRCVFCRVHTSDTLIEMSKTSFVEPET